MNITARCAARNPPCINPSQVNGSAKSGKISSPGEKQRCRIKIGATNQRNNFRERITLVRLCSSQRVNSMQTRRINIEAVNEADINAKLIRAIPRRNLDNGWFE